MEDDRKKLLLNLGSNFPRVVVKGKVTNLNAVWNTWKIKTQNRRSECQLCNMKETEDIHHVMLRCLQYRKLRDRYLGKVIEECRTSEGVNHASWRLFYGSDMQTLEETCNFWTYANFWVPKSGYPQVWVPPSLGTQEVGYTTQVLTLLIPTHLLMGIPEVCKQKLS